MDINKKKLLDDRLKDLKESLLFYKHYTQSANANNNSKKRINKGNINMANDPYYHNETNNKPQIWKYTLHKLNVAN